MDNRFKIKKTVQFFFKVSYSVAASISQCTNIERGSQVKVINIIFCFLSNVKNFEMSPVTLTYTNRKKKKNM